MSSQPSIFFFFSLNQWFWFTVLGNVGYLNDVCFGLIMFFWTIWIHGNKSGLKRKEKSYLRLLMQNVENFSFHLSHEPLSVGGTVEIP